MGATFRKIGKWNLAGSITNNLKHDIKDSNEIVLMQIGLLGEKWVVKWIQHQPSVWTPLSPEYKAWKVKKGYSEMMLRRTSTLIQNITSEVQYPRVFIGVKRGKKYSTNAGTEDISNIAAIMEFGSQARNIPARRFLSPVYTLLLNKIRKDKLFSKMLMAYLRKKYGVS